MLKRTLALLFGVLLLVGASVSGPAAPSVAAPGDVDCGPGKVPVKKKVGGRLITVTCVDAPTTGGDGDPEQGSGDGGSGQERTCTWMGAPISCGTATWVWYQPSECYAQVADPQPDADHWIWEDREPGGVALRCIRPRTGVEFTCDAVDGCGENVMWLWAPAPPDARPSPVVLARQAVASMLLQMGQIGLTGGDPEGTGWRSLIGLPIWLWVANPGSNTTGPITASASDSGLTVTATGTLDRIEWTLTSPTGVISTSCSGGDAAGTAYEPGFGDQPSPTCGFQGSRIQAKGDYTLTGTAFWVVEWSGGGEIGTIEVDPLSQSMDLEVFEVQTIRTEGG